MHWRWFILDYVDPQLGLSRRERATIRRNMKQPRLASQQSLGHGFRNVVLALIPGASMIILFPLFQRLNWFVWLGWKGVPLLVSAQLIITWTAMVLVGRWSYGPRVIEELKRLGYNVCAHCGYDLRELPSATDRCPECGRPTQQ